MNKGSWVIVGLSLAILVSAIVSAMLGASQISFFELLNIIGEKFSGESTNSTRLHHVIFWNIRLPRIVLCLFTGAGLGVSGAVLQGLFRNSLADPTIIGISSGAAMVASTLIVFMSAVPALLTAFFGHSLLAIGAFIGGLATTFLVFALARTKGNTNVAGMLLGGIAINAVAAAFTGLLTYIADDGQLRSIIFWTMGSLAGATWSNTLVVVIVVILSYLLIARQYKFFNALALGESEAGHIGIPVERLKKIVIISTALAVGATVAFCGIIGFVGLAVPHILRLFGARDYRILIPASALGGGILLCWADLIARTAVAPAELPVGIITSLVGAPLFMYLLFKQKKTTYA